MAYPALLLPAFLLLVQSQVSTQHSNSQSLEQRIDRFVQPYVRGNNFTGVILVRAQDSVFVTGIHSAVFGKSPAAPAVQPMAVKPGSLAELAGTYQMPHEYFVPDATVKLEDRGDRLEMIWTDGSRNTVYQTGPHRFLDRNFWAELSFQRDGAGKVSGFSYLVAGQRFSALRKGTRKAPSS